MARVSVVVPVYNAEKYLNQCIESLLNQTLKDIEIIFVDDGSEDNSGMIISRYAKKDSRLQFLKQENSFAGTARNLGMNKAAGEYIIFLDADDYFEADMLEEMYNKAKADDADVCLCSAKRFNDLTGEITEPNFYLNTSLLPENLPFSADELKDRIFNFTTPAPWTKLFKTAFVKANGFKFQPIKKTNDLFFIFANLSLAKRITYVNKPFVNYRFANSSSLQGEKDALNIEFYDAVMALKKELQSRELFVKYEKSFVNRALSVCAYTLKAADNKENFIKLANLFKSKYFFDFGIAGHSRAYFYNKADFDLILDIIDSDENSLWSKYKEPHENNDFPLIDIDKWQCPVDIKEYDGIKISVIIPVYNAEKYVEQCVNSVRNNTLKDIEIICINDGSTDNSLAVLNSLKEKDSRIIVVDKANGGPSETRNKGIEIARGKYISFIDSDDYIHERIYEFLYAEAEKDNLDQLYFSAVSFFDSDDIYRSFSNFDDLYKRKGDYSKIVSGKEMFIKMVQNGEFRPSPCLLISKREFLNKNKLCFYNGILHEDNLFTIQCLTYAQRVRFANINLYYRRVRRNSIMTGEHLIKRIYSYYLIIKILEQFAKENNLSKDKAFFKALLHQLSVMDYNACDIAEKVSEKELEDFIDTLDEAQAIDFYNHINAVAGIRHKNKELSKNLKKSTEFVKINEYKENHIKKGLNDEISRLRANKSALIKENNSLKAVLSKRLVRLALKIDALICRIRRKK